MICLRPAQFVASLRLACASLIALLAIVGSLAPGASAAMVHSRTHRVTPALAPLHYTERSFAVPRNAKAATAHDHTARAHREAQGIAKHLPSSKHGHEPDSAAPMPMHRARQNIVSGHGFGEIATFSTRRGARIPLPAPDPVVAEVTGRSARGDYLARLHANRTSTATPHPQTARSGSSSVVITSNSYPLPAPYAGTSGSNPRPQEGPAVPIQRRSAPGSSPTAAAQTGAPLFWNGQTSTAIYARDASPSENSYPGHSYADEPRSTPQINPYATDEIEARQVAAQPMPTVQAPAQDRRYAPIAPAAVVNGFGSEVAIAPAEPAANTRRRNHPILASDLPENARAAQSPHSWAPPPPATLAEREAITAAAVSPSILPEAYDRDDRLLMPAPLKGSREILIHQNAMADADGLERIQNDAQLNHLRAIHEIVDLPVSSSLRVNEDLPYNRRAARPWTVLFAQDITRDYYARFHQPLWVTSAVRTAAFQSRLQRVNGNAAGVYGDFASPHLTGQAIDFGKTGMSAAQIAWMRLYLLPLIQSGTIDVEEEFQQACFHLSVYRRYAANRRPAMEYAQVGSGTRNTVPPAPIRAEMQANP